MPKWKKYELKIMKVELKWWLKNNKKNIQGNRCNIKDNIFYSNKKFWKVEIFLEQINNYCHFFLLLLKRIKMSQSF